jgi:SAM-dependent methyltransferase
MCTACTTTLAANATDSTDAFAERLITTLNAAGEAMMLSLGHRTGLFDAMRHAGWITPCDLARRAELSDRYVREWLGAMTCARIVDHDSNANTYRLPDEHAALLTRAASPNNLAAVMQWIAVLGSVETRVASAFRTGQGVPYDAYERFPEVMLEDSRQTVVAALEPFILPLAPGLIDQLERGIDVLDVGCGRGLAMLHLAQRFPRSRFVGYDLLDAQAGYANDRARELGLTNARFAAHDAAQNLGDKAFDLVCTFDAIHDQARPDRVLANIARALKPDGVYLCQEIKAESNHADNLDHPAGAFIYTISTMHCMSVSLAAGGPGLGAAWGRSLCRAMLTDAGFNDITMHELDHDPLNDFWICRRNT